MAHGHLLASSHYLIRPRHLLRTNTAAHTERVMTRYLVAELELPPKNKIERESPANNAGLFVLENANVSA